MVDLRVRLLGPLAVEVDGVWHDNWPRPAARRLMALLALAAGHALSRDALVEHLFGHLPRDRGLRNVSKALSQARSVVGRERLTADSSSLRLSGDVVTDLEEARLVLTEVEKPEEVRTALAVVPDLLLDDMYEEWAQPHRWELEALAHRAAMELARTTDTEDDWIRVAALVPGDEEGWLALLRHASGRGQNSIGVVMNRCRLVWAREGLGRLPRAIEAAADRFRSTMPSPGEPLTVGREREMQRILSALERFRPVLAVGPAGIGKTHLLRQVVGRLEGRGHQAAVGTSSPEDTLYPFSSLRAALDRIPLPSSPAFLAGGGAETSPARMAAETAELLARLPNPPMLVLDDVQWADPAMKAMLTPLAAQAAMRGLGFFAAGRSDEPGQPLPAWPSDGEVLVVRELSVADASTLARHLLDTNAALDPAASDGVARSLAERSGGNPFFLTELARAASSRDDAPGSHESMPERIGALIRGRIAGLDPEATELARLIALADEYATDDLVRRQAGDRAGDIVARLRDRGVLAARSVELTHPLLRDLVVEDMSPEERRDTHRHLAAHLDQMARGGGRADVRAAAGAHRLAAYEAAPGIELAEEALEGALLAATSAARSFATASVIRLVSSAHEIFGRLPLERREALASPMAMRLLDVGEAWRLEGDEGQAETWFRHALEVANRPTERAHCYRAWASLSYRGGRMEESGAILALGLSEIDDELARAILETELAWTWHRLDRHAEAHPPLERAARVLEDAGAWPDAVRALDYLGMTLLGLNRAEESLEVMDRGLVVTGSADPRMRAILLMHKAGTLNRLDRTDEALVAVLEARRIIEAIGDIYVASVTQWVEAEIRESRNEIDEAIACRRRELEILAGTNLRHAEAARRHIAELEEKASVDGNTTGTPAG